MRAGRGAIPRPGPACFAGFHPRSPPGFTTIFAVSALFYKLNVFLNCQRFQASQARCMVAVPENRGLFWCSRTPIARPFGGSAFGTPAPIVETLCTRGAQLRVCVSAFRVQHNQQKTPRRTGRGARGYRCTGLVDGPAHSCRVRCFFAAGTAAHRQAAHRFTVETTPPAASAPRASA